MLKINIITPFPEMFENILNKSILLKGKEKKIVDYNVVNLFEYLDGPNQRIDDYPFGGAKGMVLKPEPLSKAINALRDCKINQRIIFPTPDGELYNHKKAKEFSDCDSLIFVCGHYKGIDQRIRDNYITDEVSIGDYVLTSGELPSMLMIDSVVRLKKGVLNSYESAIEDSFFNQLLDGPHYTRPREFEGIEVPDVLLSGDHNRIKEWFLKKRENKTKSRRIDLWNLYRSKKNNGENNE